MAFTVSEFRDLIQLLEQHPTWREELRRWVLTEELLALPQTVHELVESQRRTEERMGQLVGHMDELARHVGQLTTRMDELTRRMEQMAEVQLRMGSDLERLKGHDLERRYRERAPAYFGRLLPRLHVLSNDELVALLDAAVLHGQLSEEASDEILQADIVIRGRRREGGTLNCAPSADAVAGNDGTDVYLVVEVSWGVGLSDVQRAAARASLLARTGTPALPVVAGVWVTPEAQEPARAFHVWQVIDGRVTPPEDTALR
jgi:hypothetical protein